MQIKNYYVGIDPGASGAWAIIDEDCHIVDKGAFEDFDNFRELIEVHKNQIKLIVMEKVHSMPKQGVVSAFTFGENYGYWKGVFAAYCLRYSLITPQKWQAAILDFLPEKEPRKVGESVKEGHARNARNRKALKTAIADFVKRRYPDLTQFFKVKKNWDVADAICMAMYARKLDIR